MNKEMDKLKQENKLLKEKLVEFEDTLNAIQRGEIDALVIESNRKESIYSLSSAETTYRLFIEQMTEGAAIISEKGIVLYGNLAFSKVFGDPLEKIVGEKLLRFFAENQQKQFASLLKAGLLDKSQQEFKFPSNNSTDDARYYLFVLAPFVEDFTQSNKGQDQVNSCSLIVYEITKIKQLEHQLQQHRTNLEKEVEDRTRELESVNQQLSAFNQQLAANEQQLRAANQQLKAETRKLKKMEAKQLEYTKELEAAQRATLSMMEDTNLKSEKLQRSEASLKDAQQIAHIGNWFWDLQKDSLEVSDEMLNLIGFKDKEEAKDLAEHKKYYTPESWQSFSQTVESAKENGEKYEIELEFSDKNSDFRYAIARGKAVFDERNKVIALKGTLQDITNRKQAMQALKSSEKKFKTLVNTLPDYIWLKDINGVYLACNRMFEEFVGKKEAEIIGKTDYDFFDKELAEYYLKKDQEAISKKSLIKSEDRLVRAIDGKEGLLETIKVRMDKEDGSVLGVLGVGHDITERKAREEQIRQSLIEKETLLRELYHRTKNNMQLIISMLLMRERACKDIVLQEMIKDIKFKIKSMALVHQKLYQSKDLSKINLKEYIYSLTRQISASYTLDNKQIALEYDLQDVFCLIDTAIPLGLIINELVTNSFKYAWPEVTQGVVKIGLKVDKDGSIVFTMADDGIGFQPGFDLEKNKDLGLETVIMLGQHQLDGDLSYENDNGLAWKLRFKDNLYQERV